MSAVADTRHAARRRAAVARPRSEGRSRRAGIGTETELVRALLREARQVGSRRSWTSGPRMAEQRAMRDAPGDRVSPRAVA